MGLHVILQQFILLLAWIVSAVLLASFGYGFYSEMSVWLSAPFLVLVLLSLFVGGANVASFLQRPSGKESDGRKPRLLLAAIPLAFVAASLDCTGLSPYGCTGFCTFIKVIWIPLLAVVCGAWVWRDAPKTGEGRRRVCHSGLDDVACPYRAALFMF